MLYRFISWQRHVDLTALINLIYFSKHLSKMSIAQFLFPFTRFTFRKYFFRGLLCNSICKHRYITVIQQNVFRFCFWNGRISKIYVKWFFIHGYIACQICIPISHDENSVVKLILVIFYICIFHIYYTYQHV